MNKEPKQLKDGTMKFKSGFRYRIKRPSSPRPEYYADTDPMPYGMGPKTREFQTKSVGKHVFVESGAINLEVGQRVEIEERFYQSVHGHCLKYDTNFKCVRSRGMAFIERLR